MMERYLLKFEFKYIKELPAYIAIISNYVKIRLCISTISIPCGIYKPHFTIISRPGND